MLLNGLEFGSLPFYELHRDPLVDSKFKWRLERQKAEGEKIKGKQRGERLKEGEKGGWEICRGDIFPFSFSFLFPFKGHTNSVHF